MKRIYKYPLEVTDEQALSLPEGAHALSVALQGDTVCLWAMIDTDLATEIGNQDRRVRFFGTGHPVELEGNWQFLGTVLQRQFVWHIFIEATE